MNTQKYATNGLMEFLKYLILFLGLIGKNSTNY